jgi:hypothetical protein
VIFHLPVAGNNIQDNNGLKYSIIFESGNTPLLAFPLLEERAHFPAHAFRAGPRG